MAQLTHETRRQLSGTPSLTYPPQLPMSGRQQGLRVCSTGTGLLEVAPLPLYPLSLAVIGEAWEPQEGTVALTGHLLWAP